MSKMSTQSDKPSAVETTPPPNALEVAVGKVWIDGEGIIRTLMHQSDSYGVEQAQEHIAAYAKLANGKKVPILADIRRLTTGADREARQFYASEAGAKHTKAVALLVQSDVTRLLANFFFRFHKPAYPSRMFTNEVEAVEWLRGFLE